MWRRGPWVSAALVGLLYALFLLESSRRAASGVGPDLLPERWVLAGDAPRPWQFVTYAAVHIDRTHVLSNCLLLALAGAWLEPIVGGVRVAALALLSAVLVAIVFVLTSDRDLCGASGASAAFISASLCAALAARSRSGWLRAAVAVLCVCYIALFDAAPALDTVHPSQRIHAIGYAAGAALFGVNAALSRRRSSRVGLR